MRQKTKQTVILFFLFTGILLSCDSEFKTSENKNQTSNSDTIHLDLANKVYFIGPDIDSTTTEIEAGCDCCASRLLFFKDSSFIYISYCLEGDSYFTGKYTTKNETLLLNYDSLEVTKLSDMVSDIETASNNNSSKTTFEITKFSPVIPTIEASMLNSKLILSFKYKGGTEFGMEERKTFIPDIVKEMKQDSVWYKLNLK